MSTNRLALSAYANRTNDYTGSIYAANGSTPASLAAGDKLRFKLADKYNATILDLLSGTGTANDSLLTITDIGDVDTPAAFSLRLSQGDLDLSGGKYPIELIWVDDSETDPADAAKHIDGGYLTIIETPDGNLGL
jgi:hypothetical protein